MTVSMDMILNPYAKDHQGIVLDFKTKINTESENIIFADTHDILKHQMFDVRNSSYIKPIPLRVSKWKVNILDS